jgi:toxin ParE1/3/4
VNLPVVFRRPARAEFDDAADWYDRQRPGLGPAFTASVQQVLGRVASQPDFYPAVWGDVREAAVRGFPYCVYYREESGFVLVLSVFHTARDPIVWQSRA